MNRFSDERLAIQLLEYRSSSYNYRAFLKANKWRYLAIFGIVAITSVFCSAAARSPVAILSWGSPFVIGFFVGILTRDFSWVEIHQRRWPFHEKTTDWDKVQKLADGLPVDPD